jgi:hypothetical protein
VQVAVANTTLTLHFRVLTLTSARTLVISGNRDPDREDRLRYFIQNKIIFEVTSEPLLTMSDDEADPELLELLRESLGLSKKTRSDEVSGDTGEHSLSLL